MTFLLTHAFDQHAIEAWGNVECNFAGHGAEVVPLALMHLWPRSIGFYMALVAIAVEKQPPGVSRIHLRATDWITGYSHD